MHLFVSIISEEVDKMITQSSEILDTSKVPECQPSINCSITNKPFTLFSGLKLIDNPSDVELTLIFYLIYFS